MLEQVNINKDINNNTFLGLKRLYALYEISSSLIVSIDTTKNFFSIMNTLSSRLDVKKGALITLENGCEKKSDELLFGFDEDDIKNGRYNVNADIIRNVAYTKDIVFLVQGNSGIEAKGAQLTNFIDKNMVSFICVPVQDKHEKVTAIFVVDKLFDEATSLEKDVFFLRNIATSISKNLQLKQHVESEKRIFIEENERLKQELSSNYKLGNIISVNAEMQRVIETVKQVANSKVPVLITGETGTGKELIAKALHYNSERVGSAYSKVQCDALPEALLAIELFGNESVEFSMSQFPSKRGKLEACNGGTVYLDNIENMPVHIQAKLLRYLTDGEFEKEGASDKGIKSDTRIIVGTTKDIEQLLANGKLLPELYNELNIIHIKLPTLKDRQEDIPLLSKYFVKKHSKENNKKITDIMPEVLDKFMKYSWPGNIRELENCIKRMIITANSKVLDESMLPINIKNVLEEEKRYEGGVEEVIDGILKEKLEKIVSFFSMQSKKKSNLYKKIIDNIDRILIEFALKRCNDVQTDAATFLGINRNTLRTKVEKLLKGTGKPAGKDTGKGKGDNKSNFELPF